MKLLPCRPEQFGPRSIKGCQGAARLPDGTPYYIGRAPADIASRPYRYRCSGCGHYTLLTAVAFNSLPDATLQQLDVDGLAAKMLGSDVSRDRIDALIGVGIELSLLSGR